MGLYDAAMVKDNHILAAGGIARAVEKVRAAIPHTMTITVECENLDQVRQALDAGANTLLLDNMRLEALAEAVRLASGRALTEASGGVSLETVASIAATGVDLISVGALTHSAPSIDISLDFVS
jgi:nicotinate-nucleotide pyrophosphorylase (carboxylating)